MTSHNAYALKSELNEVSASFRRFTCPQLNVNVAKRRVQDNLRWKLSVSTDMSLESGKRDTNLAGRWRFGHVHIAHPLGGWHAVHTVLCAETAGLPARKTRLSPIGTVFVGMVCVFIQFSQLIVASVFDDGNRGRNGCRFWDCGGNGDRLGTLIQQNHHSLSFRQDRPVWRLLNFVPVKIIHCFPHLQSLYACQTASFKLATHGRERQ
jgi:hypothetical protein